MANSTTIKRQVEPPKSRTVASVIVGKAKKSVPKAQQRKVFTRAKLVGKFPDIRHLPAPTTAHQIRADDRRRLLSAMALD